MKRIIYYLFAALLLAGCELEKDFPDDLEGSGYIAGALNYVDTLRGDFEKLPLGKRRVMISYADGDSLTYIYAVTTDSFGTFTFNRLNRAKDYLIFFSDTVSGLRYSAYHTVHRGTDSLELTAYTDEKSQNGIFLYVLNSDFDPLEGISVGIFNNKQSFDADTATIDSALRIEKTDQYGRVIFLNYPARRYYLRAIAANPGNQLRGQKEIDLKGNGILRDTLIMAATANVKNTLAIKTVDGNGNILTDVTNCLFNSPVYFDQDNCDGKLKELKTGPQGSQKDTNLSAGDYYIYATKTINGVNYTGKKRFTIAATGTTNVEVVLAPVASRILRVAVQDENHLPVPGIKVCVFNNPLLFNAQTCDGSVDSKSTQANGIATFETLPAGAVYLYAAYPEGPAPTHSGSKTVAVAATGITTETVVLQKVGRANEIVHLIKDAANTPVNGAKLYLFTSKVLFDADTTVGSAYQGTTDLQGKYTWPVLPEGTYYLRVRVELNGTVVLKGAETFSVVNSPVKTEQSVIVH